MKTIAKHSFKISKVISPNDKRILCALLTILARTKKKKNKQYLPIYYLIDDLNRKIKLR